MKSELKFMQISFRYSPKLPAEKKWMEVEVETKKWKASMTDSELVINSIQLPESIDNQ